METEFDGRELCCCTFLSDFDAVTIKMAKEQNISLNPSKISGNCGRLMCCLKYENEVYEEKLSRLPELGEKVKTPDGEGEVDGVETLKEIVRVKIKDDDGYFYKKYKANENKLEMIKLREVKKMAYKITDKCISCGACAAECPVGCISQGDDKFVIDQSACISCGTCAGVCPVEAPVEE